MERPDTALIHLNAYCIGAGVGFPRRDAVEILSYVDALEADRDRLLRNLDAMRDELNECHTRCPRNHQRPHPARTHRPHRGRTGEASGEETVTPLTPEAIAEIRARVEAATDGPWAIDGDSYSFGIRGKPPEGHVLADWDRNHHAHEQNEKDAAAIVALRNAAPELLARLEKLEEVEAAATRAYTDRDHYKKLAEALAEALEALLSESFGENMPLLLAGDFDAVPDLIAEDIRAAKALANFRASQGEGG